MANTEQQNFDFLKRYFTLREPFMKCNICNVLYERNDITIDEYYLRKHLERKHSHIIEEIKKEIKSTWLSRYFAFNIKYESIRCIFCLEDIKVLDGVSFLRHHMLDHNIHEHTINYLTDDRTMQLNLSQRIYVRIIKKIMSDIISAGLSSYFQYDILKYGYTKLKCALCYRQFNILIDKQVLQDHLTLHYIGK